MLLLLMISAWLPLDAASSNNNSNTVRFVSFETYGRDGNAWNAWCMLEKAPSSSSSHHPQGEACCQVLRRALMGRKDDSIGVKMGRATPDSVFEQCQTDIALVPTGSLSSSFLETNGLSDLLIHSIFFWRDDDSELAKPSEKSNSGLFPPPVPLLPSASQRFVWDDRHGRWLLPSTTLQDVSTDGEDGVKAALDWMLQKDEETDDKDRWSVHLESELSESGGMHRDLRHRITVEAASSSRIKEWHESSATAKIAMIMALQIPPDLFVNVEDLFRFETHGISAELVPMESVIIDQEEPAFVSPPHLLLVVVTVDLSAAEILTAAAPSTFEFVTMLHVRYPLPFSTNETAAFRLVVLPPPQLLTATLDWDDRDPHSLVMKMYEQVRILNSPSNSAPQQQHNRRLLSLWVAAGHQADYEFTLGVTLLTAVVGAIIMLRDISRVARWD